MAEDIRWQQCFSNYSRALTQLESFIDPPALNEREQQGLIKAFEYTFELACNTLRICFAARATPRCLARATPCTRRFVWD